jgi:MoxR-like ATPase
MQAKIQNLRKELNNSFVERSQVIDGALTAILAGEHCLLFGAPGTGKSALIQALCNSIEGANYFQWLLTKFSTPEEIYGPISLKGLENDTYTRITTSKLPEAHVGFVDEIFKANSSILNSMLSIINERIFHNNGHPVAVPLISLFGASNELPESEALEAMFDRFLLRYWVGYIADQSAFEAMLLATPSVPANCLSLDELKVAQAQARALPLATDTLATLLSLKLILEDKGIRASDRRWKKILAATRAYAYLQGHSQVEVEDLEILIDCTWREPKEYSTIAAIIREVINPHMAKIIELLDAAKEFIRDLPSTEDRPKYISAAATANTEITSIVADMRKIGAKCPNAKIAALIVEADGLITVIQNGMKKACNITR